MKLLMLSDFYPPNIGGMERHVQSLSRELSKRGHEVTVCTIGHPGLPEYEEEGGVKIYRLEGLFQKVPFLYKDPARRFHPPTRDWLITRKLAQIIKQEKPDIIHAHGWILHSVIPLRKRAKIPLVVTLHNYGFLCPKQGLLTNKKATCDEPFTRNCLVCGKDIYSSVIKLLAAYYGVKVNRDRLKLMDKFIAVSSFVKEVHAKHLSLSDKDIVMIPNFYDHDIDVQREEAAGLPQDFILFVGAFIPNKGVDILIEAYQKLNTQTKLVLIGYVHPDYRYKRTENILVIENAPHGAVMQAMSKCRFAVFPSIWPEPSTTVAFEAMSQRKAVIASDVGGLRDIVVDGETGILVPPNDSDRLAEAISYLLQTPEQASQMGAKGYERFMENYTPDVVIPKIIGLYESLALGTAA